jgi:hypothetical protein
MIFEKLAQFVAFMAMVSWGLMTSLVLMPVILSLWGPIVCTTGPRQTRSECQQLTTGGYPKADESIGSQQSPSFLDKYRIPCDDGDSDSDSGILDTSIELVAPRKEKKLFRLLPGWVHQRD